jgi:hypothetical protein
MPNKYVREFTFPNGYGASVVSHENSYGGNEGLFEVAVLKGGDLCYNTPVTDNVVGWCDFDRVAGLLAEIAALPAAVQAAR